MARKTTPTPIDDLAPYEADYSREHPATSPLPGQLTLSTSPPAHTARTNTLAPLHSSDSDEWWTPRVVIDAARAVLGGIDLDPASSAAANRTVRATRYFDARTNGLQHRWSGRVWLNPPFSQVALWAMRMAQAYETGELDAGLLLVAVRSDTAWWYTLRRYPVCFWAGRITFTRPSGPTTSAPFPAALIYLGPDTDRFIAVMGQYGLCYGPLDDGNRVIKRHAARRQRLIPVKA